MRERGKPRATRDIKAIAPVSGEMVIAAGEARQPGRVTIRE